MVCSTRKGKGNGRNGDTSPKSPGGRTKAASLQYLDGLPILPNQLQQMSGTYAWIREENAPKHREARLDAGRQLQEAFEKGGFAVSSGGKKQWDVDGDGQLCLDEVANPNMPASFLSWVRATAVRRLSEKLPSS